MWVWIIMGVVVLAGAVYACGPGARGVRDADALSSRRSTQGKIEEDYVSNRQSFQPW